MPRKRSGSPRPRSKKPLTGARSYSARTVIAAQKRVLKMALGIIWAAYQQRAGKQLQLLITDGSSLMTIGEALDTITAAMRLKVKGEGR